METPKTIKLKPKTVFKKDKESTDEIPQIKFSDNNPGKKKLSKRKIILLVILALFIIAILISVYPVLQIYRLSRSAYTAVTETMAAAQAQDLVASKEKLNTVHSRLSSIQTNYRLLSWWKITPLRWHYQDGERGINASLAGVEAGQEIINAVEPHIDVLGFKGEGTYTGGTTEDRIVAILSTFGELAPNIDTAAAKLDFAASELNLIDPARYPNTIRDIAVRDLIKTAQEQVTQAATLVNNARPVVEILPDIAGVKEPKKYFILFQNDAELRPTGGFMTAYAIVEVNRGKVIPERSVDIYSLDNKFRNRLDPPDPIKNYLPLVYYWHLRDMNISPDFKVSMDTFLENYLTVPGESEVDGIISIDTNVLKDLVEILGPIDVPGFGTFSSDIDERCDCPQVIYKLEDLVTRPTYEIRTDRKAVLGPMMQTIIQKAYDADSNAWPALFQAIFANINEKHILFYMLDEKAQVAAENFGVAGRIKEFDGDYFHLNDANFGGAKSNMFVTQEITQDITLEGDKVRKQVTIIYKNPFPSSNCNLEAGQLCINGILRNFVRVYLPQGSELEESLGFEDDTEKTYEELGKTVVEGFFQLQPQSQAKIKLSYTVPYNPDGEYQLMIQKQPGTYNPKYTVTVNNTQEEFFLTSDKILKLPL